MIDHRTSRPLLPDHAISEWMRRQDSAATASACVRYALAFNTLDIGWFDGALSPSAMYESQSVFEKLSGRDRIHAYLDSKMEACRREPEFRPRFELATTSMGEPCAAGFQAMGKRDQSWLAQPKTNVVFRVDGQGLIHGILAITTVPAPDAAIRSGLYPGAVDIERAPERFIRPASDYRGLRFVFFLLDGRIDLDRRMEETRTATLPAFPGADCEVICWEQLQGDERGELDRAQFTGFPSVAVYWEDECVFRQEGWISTDALIAFIRDATKLYVAD